MLGRAWALLIFWGIAALLLFTTFTAPLTALLQKLVPGFPSSASTIASWMIVGAGVFGGAHFCLWILRWRIRRSLRLSLLASGVPVCLHCCYNVRGQSEARCPECGQEFAPELRELWEQLQAKPHDAEFDPNPQLTKVQLTQPLTKNH